MEFLKRNYVGVLHLVIVLLLVIVGLLVQNLIGRNKELSKVKYVTNTIFIQEAPREKNKDEKIMIDYSIKKYSKLYNVDEALVRAIIKHESNFNPTAMSSAGCIGLMQISADKTNNPFDIETNVKVGTKYISHLLKKYNGNTAKALHAYNCGVGCVARNQVPNSTRKYANKILADRGKV